ncbi:MAG: prepilin peptidase [Candidatus Berkelbacteria bacterium]|nr:prepilin peptidase [Candidatus Berkelbacteria bacterium]
MSINIIIYILAFIFGAIIGSFSNVVIYRLKIAKNGKANINLSGRSKCPHCKKELTIFELIPILSFVFLSARCAKCKKPISWQYPLVEIISGILTVIPLYFLGFSNIYAYLVILILYLFIVIFFYDLKNFIVPDVALYPLFFLILVFDIIKLAKHDVILLNLFIGTLIGGGLFLILVYFSREKWMGWGDVKLGFLLGLLLAYPYIIVSHVMAFIIGAVISLILIGFRGKTLKSEVPFAPFLVLAATITLFWGQMIINWYFRGF